MPVQDLVSRVRQIASNPKSALADLISDGESSWTATDENLALLLEIQSYQLELNWVDRITDPDDPEVKRERALARKTRPPEHPLVPPVAVRPRRIAEQRYETYLEKLMQQQIPDRVRQQVDSDEFDRLMGLT
jgi:hypothetical protein